MRKLIFYIVLILLFIGFGFWVRSIVLKPSNLPVHQVSVYLNTSNLAHQPFKKVIIPLVQNTNLLNVDIQQLKITIEKKPGVAYVDIERVWPNRLNIQIRSWIPVALWNKHTFLNAYGEIFSAPHQPNQKLPAFFGNNKTAIKMLDYYQQITHVLSPLLLSIKIIRLADSGAWSITLNNKVKLKLGYGNIVDKMRLFASVYPKLVASHSILPKTVDLRYKHGMAVRW